MKMILLFLFTAMAIEARSIDEVHCEISIDHRQGDLKEPQPLILTDTTVPTFVLPNERRLLLISRNTSILLACPGRNNALRNFGTAELVKAVCLNGKQFSVQQEVYEFSIFRCKTSPKETVKKAPTACLRHHQRYDIGYTIKNHFVPLVEIYRDDRTYQTLYSKSIIVKEIAGHQSSYPRPSWKYGSYYPRYNVNSLYKAKAQRRTLEALLGSAELARQYASAKQYLTRGHLTAKADFVYGAQQSATFWYLNAAPQWASFNSGNWLVVEQAARDQATKTDRDLTVYTGTHGQTTLIDVNGTERPLYLHANESVAAFPVPRFFWKVVHEPLSNRAVAYVGVNEPYAKNLTADMYLCADISEDPAFGYWSASKRESIKHGVIYVCTVEDLRKAVPTIPQFNEVGVLI